MATSDSSWELVLGRLSARELCRVAPTSSVFADVVRKLHRQREEDVSRGLEDMKIPHVGRTGGERYAEGFTYTRASVMVDGTSIEVTEADYATLDCSCSKCEIDKCPCLSGCFIQNGRLTTRHGAHMRECGEKCGCRGSCPSRVVQKGVSQAMFLKKVPGKGWGVFAGDLISAGQFVCEYAGEVLTTEEARRRQMIYDRREMNYLLVIREVLPSRQTCFRVNIDPTHVGNVGRFFNHSCDGGNLEVFLVRVGGCPMPRAAFFAKADIAPGTELTFSYGGDGDYSAPVVEGENASRRECTCGASSCKGVLPSEVT
uniref:Histone-lysine N-methyltransferase n=1 Tax=Pyramimonas obovata TaxID=1411642 RepID=A0A7S0RHE1_9CHLO|mmetsp:Transcript_33957/g.74288  ORF Transcript_33957/g.74288 Transcript_33957/m.74288 type:complete len:314 (+) Transcript_33957:50-991(+)